MQEEKEELTFDAQCDGVRVLDRLKGVNGMEVLFGLFNGFGQFRVFKKPGLQLVVHPGVGDAEEVVLGEGWRKN